MNQGEQQAPHAPLGPCRNSDGNRTKESKGSKESKATNGRNLLTAPSRRFAGARARSSGAAFELWLARYVFTPLVHRGALVRFDKQDPPTRPIWDAGRWRAVMLPIGVGGGDWVLLAPGGRYLVCESKSTADARFYRAELPAHQAKHLDDAANAGGGAFLALQFRDGPTSTAFLVPWQSVPWAKVRSAPSITAADLGPWPLRGWLDAALLLGTQQTQTTHRSIRP